MRKPSQSTNPDVDSAAGVIEGEPLDINPSNSITLGRLLKMDTRPISSKHKRLIVRQTILLLQQFYAHLSMKRSLYAADPVRQLQLLEPRVHELDNLGFHRAMTGIMATLHDLHTQYLLPKPFTDQVAFLPFQVEECLERGQNKFLVTSVQPSLYKKVRTSFVAGVEVKSWNGVPIERALELVADRSGGGNDSARRARGLARLTVRVLAKLPPPDEAWVIVGYRTLKNQYRQIRLWWRTIAIPNAVISDGGKRGLSGTLGSDLEGIIGGRVRKILLDDRVQPSPAKPPTRRFKSEFPDIFDASKREGFAYIRLRSFVVDTLPDNMTSYVEEFVRLLRAVPKNGLILDIRDNPGGDLLTAEILLQTLTSKIIEPARFQVINSVGTAKLCAMSQHPPGSAIDFSRWKPSVDRGIETGAVLSSAFPISNPTQLKQHRHIYPGPLVLITNALCYSAADLFAAGFADNGIGTILGVHEATGGGGANVFTHDQLRELLNGRRHSATDTNALEMLPRNVGLRVALRRTVRVGKQFGTEIEDLGVAPDWLHSMTRKDILEKNVDLVRRAAQILQKTASAP
jgi:C-terminal processing protease CtpA/Prc